MRENPDRGPIFDTCDNLAESFRLHRPGLLFAARDVMEHGTAACLVYCALMFAAPVEAPWPLRPESGQLADHLGGSA